MSSDKKPKTNPIFFTVIIIALVSSIALFFLFQSLNKEDYYSEKYAEDYNWYMTACSDGLKNGYKATTLLYCDCGYYEFRNTYGNKKIYGNLSVSDVLGTGSEILKNDSSKETISDDALFERINVCYKNAVNDYKKAHPNVDLDQQWNNGENMIIPERVIDSHKK